jgi:D-alanyl-D-alanine-carboxypeptidase/D-alanyl-D-alanine-endopeptidase
MEKEMSRRWQTREMVMILSANLHCSQLIVPVATVLALGLMAPCSCEADPGIGNPILNMDQIGDLIDQIVSPMVSSGERVGILVAIVLPEGTFYLGYGETVKGNGLRPDEDTLFQIASITKTFTALLLADMVERETVALDDPVEDLLPSSLVMPESMGRGMTLLDLATHTSGLPSMPDNFAPEEELNPYADYTLEMLYEFLSSHALGREPGTLYEYSNVGMALLGHALELRAGIGYKDLVLDRICGPLGLLDTCFALSSDQEQRLAQGYWGERNSSGYTHEAVPPWDTGVFAPAGGLFSTGSDMAAYIRANIGTTETDLSKAIQIAHGRSRTINEKGLDVLLAWHAMDSNGSRVIMHHGATFGFNGDVVFVKEDGVGVLLLSNTYVHESETLDEAGLEILRILTESTCMPNYRRLADREGTLEAEFQALNSSHQAVQVELGDLKSSYSRLNATYQELRDDQEVLRSRLSGMRSAAYLLTVAAIALAFYAGYVMVKQRRLG